MFQQGGVSTNPQGYAQGAVQPYGGGFGMLAQLQMLKGFEGSSSSSSSSSKVKIVKYDDEFGKGWCAKNLKKPVPSSTPAAAPGSFSEDELKKNPPLALKFGDKDCNVLIPIPSHEAMCATSKIMLGEYLGATQVSVATEDQKKKASIRISKALLVNYVSKCDHSDQKLSPSCFHADELGVPVPPKSREEMYQDWAALPANANKTPTDFDTDPLIINGQVNFKDNINAWI